MKRKKQSVFLLLILLICCMILFLHGSPQDGTTVQSREKMLEDRSDGTVWHIAAEQKLHDHILCGIISDRSETGIAVFEPYNKGYRLDSRSWTDSPDDIILTQFISDGQLYDIVWFNGQDSEYVQLKYSYGNGIHLTERFQTSDGNLVYNPAPSDEYNLEAVYYDNKGRICAETAHD